MCSLASDLHLPVLRDEVLSIFSPLTGKTIVDGTLGLGGHAEALLTADSSVHVIGIDRDTQALALASERLAPLASRLRTIHGNFGDLSSHLVSSNLDVVDGVLLDIGVSSLHLDRSERGFSFRNDGPLDMRMDQHASITAAEWIQSATERELSETIFRYGEERYARRIARGIVSARMRAPINTTGELAAIVRRSVPSKYDGRRLDPATRTFQAIRMHINDELGELERGLTAGFEHLRAGGVFVVISFHSLEDRVVKRFFREKARDCVCPPDLPECMCEKRVEARILTRRPVTATADEIASNPRSRSAKLRAAERLE